MATLKNQRWEMYCQGLARGKSATDAYADAGYKPCRRSASALRTKPDIIARVLELQGNRQNRLVLSKTYVIEALLENAEKALGRKPVKISRRVKIGDGEYQDEIAEVYLYEGAVANAAIKMAGSELGLFIDRKDFRISTGYDKLTDAELAEQLVKAGQLLLEDQASQVIEHDEGES